MKITRRQLSQIISEALIEESATAEDTLKSNLNEGKTKTYASYSDDGSEMKLTIKHTGSGKVFRRRIAHDRIANHQQMKNPYGMALDLMGDRANADLQHAARLVKGDWTKQDKTDTFSALGRKIAKAYKKGKEEGRTPEEKADRAEMQKEYEAESKKSLDKQGIVFKIEKALGMDKPDEKWTEAETDKAWQSWVDGKKAAIEKDHPGDVDLLKKSWSKFAKKNKAKGVKGGTAGIYAFIKKYGALNETPVNQATLYRRRYRR